MINKIKEKECLSNNKTCSFPECDHQCGYNPDVDDASIYCETQIESETLTTLEKEKILACIGYFIKDFEIKSDQEQYDFYSNLKTKLQKIL